MLEDQVGRVKGQVYVSTSNAPNCLCTDRERASAVFILLLFY